MPDSLPWERRHKILEPADLPGLRDRVAGRRMVFASGCFDVFHAGHAVFFDQCRALGEVLVAGVGRDSYIRRMKGPSRPVNPETNRIYLVAALESVDFAVLTNDPPPGETDITGLLRAMRPHVLALTEGDTDTIAQEKSLCLDLGIELVIVPRVAPDGIALTSSTAILDKGA